MAIIYEIYDFLSVTKKHVSPKITLYIILYSMNV